MIKIKLLFLVLFLFLFELSFSFAMDADRVVIIMENNIENQLLCEDTYKTQTISGELSKSHFDDLYNLQQSKSFLTNNNTKEYHFSIVEGNLLFNSVLPGHLFISCLSKKVINVPIYLQTGKFLL